MHASTDVLIAYPLFIYWENYITANSKLAWTLVFLPICCQEIYKFWLRKYYQPYSIFVNIGLSKIIIRTTPVYVINMYT